MSSAGTDRIPRAETAVRPRLFVLGLDGLSPVLLNRFCRDTPGFSRIRDEGVSGTLRTIFPPVSPVAWGSVFTGQSPAAMGLHGWKRFGLDGRMTPVRRDEIAVPTIFDIFGVAGLRYGAVGFPLSDPAPNHASAWVRGHFDRGTMDAVVPQAAADVLRRHFLVPPVDAFRTPPDAADYPLYRAHRMNGDRIRVASAMTLFDELDLDVAMVHCAYTDNVIHSGWSDNDARRAYEHADDLVSGILDGLPEDASFMIVSDHGVETKDLDVSLGAFLHHIGLLHVTNDLDDDRVTSRAYRAASSRAGLSGSDLEEVADRFDAMSPADQKETLWSEYALRGTLDNIDLERSLVVPIGPYGQLVPIAKSNHRHATRETLDEIRTRILDARDQLVHPETGETLIDDVVPVEVNDETLADDELAPSLRIVFTPGVRLITKTFPFGYATPFVAERPHPFRGEHHPDGYYAIRAAVSPALQAGRVDRSADGTDASILSVAPSILAFLGLSPGTGMDSGMLPGLRPQTELTRIGEIKPNHRSASPLDDSERHEMIERLRAMGYHD